MWRCDTPPLKKRGISAIPARYPKKTRQKGAIPPLCDTISKRYCAIRGGISHWAAKWTSRVSKTLVTQAQNKNAIEAAILNRPKASHKRVFTLICCRVHAKGVVLCERACFCLLSAF